MIQSFKQEGDIVNSKFGKQCQQIAHTRAFPFSACGYLQTAFASQQNVFSGTGFLIWHNAILTCAHLVYRRCSHQHASSIRFTPLSQLQDQDKQCRKYLASIFYVPAQYKNAKNRSQANQNDYALIILNTIDSLCSKLYSKLPFEQRKIQVSQKEQILIIGFPMNQNKQKNNAEIINTMYGANGEIKRIEGNRIIYYASTGKGFSGSPILTINRNTKNQNQVYKLIGIHTAKMNDQNFKAGVWLSKQVRDRILYWGYYIDMFEPQKIKLKIKPEIQRQIEQNLLQQRFFTCEFLVKQVQKYHLQNQMKYRQPYKSIQDEQKQYKIASSMYFSSKNYPKVLEMCGNVYMKFKVKNDSMHRAQLASIVYYMGRIYKIIDEYPKAIKCFQQAIRITLIQEKKNTSQHALYLLYLGKCYGQTKKDQIAKKYMNDSYQIALKQPSGKEQLALIVSNLAIFQQKDKNYYESIRLNKKSLTIMSDKVKERSYRVTPYLNNIGDNFLQMGNIKQAKYYLNQALQNFQISNQKFSLARALPLKNMGLVLSAQGLYKQAIQKFKQGMRVIEHVVGSQKAKQHQTYKIISAKLSQIEKKIQETTVYQTSELI